MTVSLYPQTRTLITQVTPQVAPAVSRTITPPGEASVPVTAVLQPRAVQVQVVTGGAPSGAGNPRLQDDPTPTLGGDLTLNGFSIIGTLTAPGLVLDSGLLEAI